MIEVKSPGLFTTVQDLGRMGFGPLGVSPSGAGDPMALRIGNRLVGNPEGAAALEMTLLGGTFLLAEERWVAFTGASLDWTPRLLRAGETLRTPPMPDGARIYLCVAGGIDVPLFAGSASTHILSGLGGFEGRALRKGDRLRVGPVVGPPRRLRTGVGPLLEHRKTLRVTRGPQWDWFDPAALFAAPCRVTDDSNRLGLRLQGVGFAGAHGKMISEGVPLGAIQVPAGGQPIILFVEQQTTGGYPKIANVIAADLPSVGQLRPRDEVRFELVTPAVARAAIREQEALLRSEDLFLP
jgi:antagonist of KipI